MPADASAYLFGRDAADLGTWSYTCYMVFAVLATLMMLVQLAYLRRLRVATSYLLLPILSFCVAYENFALYLSSAHDASHELSHIYIGYILNSLTVPLFLLVLYELVFKLHEFRNAHFFCFELEVNSDSLGANVVMWMVRLFSVVLIAMQLIVQFNWAGINNDDPAHTGSAGLVYLAEHSDSIALWFSLIPSLVLSLFGCLVSTYIFKYGTYVALDNNTLWKTASFSVLFQFAGQFFNHDVYAVTANAGELVLLCGLTLLVYLAQKELSQAASYADFLHRSNRAFKAISIAKTEVERLTEKVSKRLSAHDKGLKGHKNRHSNNRNSGAFVASFVRKASMSMDGRPISALELLQQVDEDELSVKDPELEKRMTSTGTHGGGALDSHDEENVELVRRQSLQEAHDHAGVVVLNEEEAAVAAAAAEVDLTSF